MQTNINEKFIQIQKLHALELHVKVGGEMRLFPYTQIKLNDQNKNHDCQYQLGNSMFVYFCVFFSCFNSSTSRFVLYVHISEH